MRSMLIRIKSLKGMIKNMKRILAIILIINLAFLFGCCAVENSSQSKSLSSTTEVTDMAGRKVTVPTTINKVYSTGQPGVVMLYTLCPEKLLGWCIKPAKEEAIYLNPKYLSLPVIGLMQGGNSTANKEEIMARHPDIILLMTDIDSQEIQNADELQASLGIPVVVADMSLGKLSSTYRFLGDILGEKERASTLAEYCDTVISHAIEITKTIPENEKLTVYYAQGSTGLQTAPAGSAHSEVLDMVGGLNVVSLQADSNGRLNVNMEQVLKYNPQVIITSYSMGHGNQDVDSSSIFSIIKNTNDAWSNVKAVKDNMVFSTPCYPYNWLDMPPSVNRIIGITWLSNLLYPKYYKCDIKTETKNYYKLFYSKELSDSQVDTLLLNAIRK